MVEGLFLFLYCKVKHAASAFIKLHPDFASMQLDNFFANGKTDACARIFSAVIKTLKNYEDSFPILF